MSPTFAVVFSGVKTRAALLSETWMLRFAAEAMAAREPRRRDWANILICVKLVIRLRLRCLE